MYNLNYDEIHEIKDKKLHLITYMKNDILIQHSISSLISLDRPV
jgi:hypothetical protein